MKDRKNITHKLKIKKGDTVLVIAGRSRLRAKDSDGKGKRGKVLKINVEKNTAIVEGVNMVSKHVKPSAENPNGGIIQQEAPINISNLMLIDPSTGEPTRVGKKKDKKGKLQRYSKKSGEFID